MRLALKLGAVLLAGGLAGVFIDVQAHGFVRGRGGTYVAVPPPPTISSVSFSSPPFRYNSNYPTHYTQGDTWYSTWGDDGKIYVTCNDCTLQQAGTSAPLQNLMLNTMTTYDNSTVIATVAGNALLTPWGRNSDVGSDGATYSFKSAGLLCYNANLYLNVRRYNNAAPYPFSNMQIIKSTDHGATWNPQPPGTNQPYASVMFPGTNTPSGYFQYGQCYTGAGPDNSSAYIYAGVHEGGIACCQHRAWLARVPVGGLDTTVASAANWQYYTGAVGANDGGTNSADWTSTFSTSTATVILDPNSYTGTTLPVSNCCGSSWLYLPRYQQYLHFGVGSSGYTDSYVTAFAAPYPWGPWRVIGQFESNPWGEGWTNPIPASLQNGGQTVTLISSGNNQTCCDPSQPGSNYTPFLRTMTISP